MSWDWEELKNRHNLETKKKKGKSFSNLVIIILTITSFIVIYGIGHWVGSITILDMKNKAKQQIIEMVNPEVLKDKYKGG